jgi:hypothetical protein
MMVSPRPPRLRDSENLRNFLRREQTNLRQLGVGFLSGRYPPARPLGTTAGFEVSDEELDVNLDSPLFRNVDRAVASAGQVLIPLTYEPIDGSLHVRWNGLIQPPNEWILAGRTVRFVNPHVRSGDVFTVAYVYYPRVAENSPLILRGATLPINGPISVALPTGTEVGDLIVVANATMHYNGLPGGGTPADSRLTQVGHGAWVGIATDLSPVTFVDPLAWDVDRHTVAIAVFAPPSAYENSASVGPSSGGSGNLVAPEVAAAAAALVVTEDAPNGTIPPMNTVPSGYTIAVDPDGGGSSSTVCKVGIWYWSDPDASISPSGTIHYEVHASGHAYATTIGIDTV